MLVKLLKSIATKELEKEFPNQSQEIQCYLHEVGIKKVGSIVNVKPTVKVEEGVEYYTTVDGKVDIPVDWVIPVKNPIKYLDQLPSTFKVKDVNKIYLSKENPQKRASVLIWYSLKRGYITRIGRGKYQKVN